MLSSSRSGSREEEDDHPSSSSADRHHPALPCTSFTSSAAHMRQLLISCAELVSQSDFTAAQRLVSLLSTTSSPYGDSTDRLVHQFSRALSFRINSASTTTAHLSYHQNNNNNLVSSYLSLNQVTPFIRFSHLTANQAILEAIEGQNPRIHILDFDTMHGVQWPPLMQAIAERSNPSNPPFIRITGTGHNLDTLRRTGDRLEKFAQSLGLRFQFHPLLLLTDNEDDVPLHLPSSVSLLPDETLAVNCVLYLHRFLTDDSLRLFLRTIKAMNPKVLAIAEREANHHNPIFLQRFLEALDHYTALFASLEATLPPNSQERLSVEQVWFGREILDIVCGGDHMRRERHERLESWVEKLMSSGFSNVPLSPFALSQAKLLLRLHYPSEGYHLKVLNDSFFLGWQNQALFSVSSWH